MKNVPTATHANQKVAAMEAATPTLPSMPDANAQLVMVPNNTIREQSLNKG